ncbi:hypothetical protein JHK85_012764 [Glycine max]|nr:hypothetical protein JHK85_012764 [Glycine max]
MLGHRLKSKKHDVDGGGSEKQLQQDPFEVLSICATPQIRKSKPSMELALLLEKLTNEKLLNLHSVASKSNDAQLSDFIESEFLGEQVEAIKKISEYVAQLRRVGKGHGVWHFDQMLLHEEGVAFHFSKSTERPNNLIFSGARVKAISIVGSNLAFFSVMQTKLDFVPENVSTLAWL